MAASAAAVADKTPVSLVQEMLVRRGLFPKYDLIDIQGASHKPKFRYRVTAADVVGMYDNTCLS
jgi:RISC-loading complex subunit TARBP2